MMRSMERISEHDSIEVSGELVGLYGYSHADFIEDGKIEFLELLCESKRWYRPRPNRNLQAETVPN